MKDIMQDAPLVSVCCLTYNHEDTIAQAIEGIVKQETNFAFELIVHDDASTDKTADIIRSYKEQYPDIIVPILQEENQFYKCNLAKEFVNPKARGKYIAICEGDDYWTDSLKLQKQIDYMEANPGCTMTFHAIHQLNSDGTFTSYYPLKKTGVVSTEEVIKRGGLFCPSVSLVIRRDICEIWPDFRLATRIYDFPIQVLSAINGEVYYINEAMGVYRFAAKGSWTEAHEEKTDYKHMQIEEEWLRLFNEYTQERYADAVNYHLARIWSIEYRKNFETVNYKNAKKYLALLKGVDALKIRLRLIIYKIEEVLHGK